MKQCLNLHKKGQHPYVVIPVNTLGVMGAGLAKDALRQFPRASAYYQRMAKAERFMCGDILWHPEQKLGYDGVLFASTKGVWWEPSTLGMIRGVAKELWMYLMTTKNTFLYIPHLGCGKGGLDWETQVFYILKAALLEYEDRYVFVERL